MKGKAAIEDDLHCFFHDVGCRVANVRLVLDTRCAGRNRGFSFVDLEDHESLNLALNLRNKEAEGLAEKDGKLHIEKARDATHQAMERKQGGSHAWKQFDEGERKLALCVARLNEILQVGQAEVRVRRTFIEVGENWNHYRCSGERRQRDRLTFDPQSKLYHAGDMLASRGQRCRGLAIQKC